MTACFEQGSQLFFVAGSIWKTWARVEKTGCSLQRNTLIRNQIMVSLRLKSHPESQKVLPHGQGCYFYWINMRLWILLKIAIVCVSHFTWWRVLVTWPIGLDFLIRTWCDRWKYNVHTTPNGVISFWFSVILIQ